jgi:hypothetical protein
MPDLRPVGPGDRSLVPGAMETQAARTLPSGHFLEFEQAPAGWLKRDGKPRAKDWRAYYITPPDGARKRLMSVSTLLDTVMPKPGLPTWAEARGIEGAREALDRGLVGLGNPSEEWINAVRANRLGADRARDDAADRGLDVHAVLERWLKTGQAPNPAEHPEAHRPYVRGLVRWILYCEPEPVQVEEIVAHPTDMYAGRGDLVAIMDGKRTRVDLKTQARGAIFAQAHLQVRLYERAEVASGGEPCDRLRVVVVDDRGGFREMECLADDELADAAVAFAARVQPLTNSCDGSNRVERIAREAA